MVAPDPILQARLAINKRTRWLTSYKDILNHQRLTIPRELPRPKLEGAVRDLRRFPALGWLCTPISIFTSFVPHFLPFLINRRLIPPQLRGYTQAL
eukprot:6475800-Amphidinium_carterae.1